MARKNRRKPLGSQQAFQLIIDSRRSPADMLSDLRGRVDSSEYRELITKLRTVAKTRHLFAGLMQPDLEAFARSGRLSPILADSEIRWALVLTSTFEEETQFFFRQRRAFESAIMEDRFQVASDILGNIESRLGCSLWAIKTRIALLQKLNGIAAQKEYVRMITERVGRAGRVPYIAYFASRRSEGTLNAIRLREIMAEATDTIPDAATRRYLRYHLAWPDDVDESYVADILNGESSGSLVDTLVALHYFGRLTPARSKLQSSRAMVRMTQSIAQRHADSRLDTAAQLSSGVQLLRPDVVEAECQLFRMLARGEPSLLPSTLIPRLNGRPDDGYATCLAAIAGTFGDMTLHGLNPSVTRRVRSLARILNRNAEPGDYDELLSITVCHPDFDWSAKVLSLGSRAATDFLVGKLRLPALGGSGAAPLTPMHLLTITNSDSAERYLALLREMAPRTMEELVPIQLSPDPLTGPATSLGLILQAAVAIHRRDYEQAMLISAKARSSPSRFVRIEGLLLYLRAAILANDESSSSDAVVHALLLDEQIPSLIPLRDCSALIVLALAERTYKPTFAQAIVLSLFSRLVDNSLDVELSFVVESLLSHNQVSAPAEIADASDGEQARLVYFLAKVCTPGVLEALPNISGSAEVSRQRIAICDRLMQLDQSKSQAYLAEKIHLAADAAARAGAHAIAQSRVFVETTRLLAIVTKAIGEDFVRARLLAKSPSLVVLMPTAGTLTKLGAEGPDSIVVTLRLPEDEARLLIVRMLTRARDEYTSNSAYGLDGYLSTRIRHGTLLGQMRRSLERAQLITRVNKSTGHYAPNNHWRSKLAGEGQEITEALTARLMAFSRDFDAFVEEIRSLWLRVSKAPTDPGLFLFEITDAMVVSIRGQVERSATAEQFAKQLIAVLDEELTKALVRIRTRLNTEARLRFIELFTSLKRDVEELGKLANSQNGVAELTRAIASTATNFTYDLSTIVAWFKSTPAALPGPFRIDDIVAIAREDLRNTGRECLISNITYSGAPLLFPGESHFQLVDLVEILLGNAVAYSGDSQQPHIDAVVDYTGRTMRLTISNTISDEEMHAGAVEKIRQLQEELLNEQLMERAATEGRSGYPKVKKILTLDLNWQHEIAVQLINKRYSVTVSITLPT